jgi:cell division protein FtsA
MNELSRAGVAEAGAEGRAGLSIGPAARGRFRRASGTLAALDIGSTKITCLIGRVESDGQLRVLSVGQHRARGIRAGSVVDFEQAEASIRAAVAQAEELADMQVREVVTNLSCGRPASHRLDVRLTLGGHAADQNALRRIVLEGRARAYAEGREIIHALPLGYAVDGTEGVKDPRGMVCETLSARLHIVDAEVGTLRNLASCLARCDLDIEALVAAPFAAGLAALVEDERELGVTVIDMGGGTTSLAVFAEGQLQHTDVIPVGGQHVTNDIARGLSTTIAHAERMKTLHGSTHAVPEDERELLPVPLVGEDDHAIAKVPRSMLAGIIRPRLEETFELVRERLEDAGLGRAAGRRVVLTGGASQLIGVRDLAAQILDKQVRHGRPPSPRGLPDSASGPAFAVPVGLLVWAATEGQIARDLASTGHEAPPGLLGRLATWLRERL